MKTLDPIGLFRYLNPRASGLIVFKGGGGGASAEEVDASVAAGTEAVNANTNAGFAEAETQLAETTAAVETVGSNVGTASETGTTNVGTGSFTTPVVEKQVVNPDGSLGTETVGGETVTYGGGTANVTDTVKGDTEQIIGGQQKTDDLINKRFDTFQPTTVVSQSVDTSDLAKADAMADGFATSASNQEKILADTGAISTAVGTGFADVGQDLSNLSTGQTNIGNQITDLSGNMGTRFDTVDETLGTGFADVNTNIDDQFTAQNENLTELSSNILGGQTSLQEYLESMSDRADTYYGGLAEGQANIQSSVGGLQDNFGDFRKQYTDDTTLANQARADLANQVTGGFSQVRDDLDRNFDATSQQNATITRNTEQTMRNQDDMTTSFGAAFNQIGAGVEAQTSQQQAAKTDMLQRLNTIREVILAEGQNLDPALTMQYAKLADSFDADGRLIQQSTNSNGTVTQRGFDPNNNLNLATFNQQGQVVDRTRLNIDQLMSQMDQMGYGGSSNTGLMSGSQPFQSTVM